MDIGSVHSKIQNKIAHVQMVCANRIFFKRDYLTIIETHRAPRHTPL